MFRKTDLLLLIAMTGAIASCFSASSQPAPPPVYSILWQYCVPAPKPVDALSGARKTGCASNHRAGVFYVWGESDWGERYQPEGILIEQRSVVNNRSDNKYLDYKVAIQSRGCFNRSNLKPGELAYYSADVWFGILKSIAQKRPVIEGVEVIAQRVSSQKLKNLLQTERAIALPGREKCRRLEIRTHP